MTLGGSSQPPTWTLLDGSCILLNGPSVARALAALGRGRPQQGCWLGPPTLMTAQLDTRAIHHVRRQMGGARGFRASTNGRSAREEPDGQVQEPCRAVRPRPGDAERPIGFDRAIEPARAFEAITCLALRPIHRVNPITGKVSGADADSHHALPGALLPHCDKSELTASGRAVLLRASQNVVLRVSRWGRARYPW